MNARRHGDAAVIVLILVDVMCACRCGASRPGGLAAQLAEYLRGGGGEDVHVHAPGNA